MTGCFADRHTPSANTETSPQGCAKPAKHCYKDN